VGKKAGEKQANAERTNEQKKPRKNRDDRVIPGVILKELKFEKLIND